MLQQKNATDLSDMENYSRESPSECRGKRFCGLRLWESKQHRTKTPLGYIFRHEIVEGMVESMTYR